MLRLILPLSLLFVLAACDVPPVRRGLYLEQNAKSNADFQPPNSLPP